MADLITDTVRLKYKWSEYITKTVNGVDKK